MFLEMSREVPGLYSHVVKEIKARMASFTLADLIYEGRSMNIDTYVLAKGSLYRSLGRHVWSISPHEGVCISYPVAA